MLHPASRRSSNDLRRFGIAQRLGTCQNMMCLMRNIINQSPDGCFCDVISVNKPKFSFTRSRCDAALRLNRHAMLDIDEILHKV